MSDESIEVKLARLSDRMNRQEDATKDLNSAVFGDHGKGGLINELKDVKTENKYLRLIYILITALCLPLINAILTRIGLGPIKLGGG